MKKVSAICVYEKRTDCVVLHAFTVTNCKGSTTQLIGRHGSHCQGPFHYDTFNGMYNSLLQHLKNNNMYTAHYASFGREWYDIVFIDLHNPTQHEKFGCKTN